MAISEEFSGSPGFDLQKIMVLKFNVRQHSSPNTSPTFTVGRLVEFYSLHGIARIGIRLESEFSEVLQELVYGELEAHFFFEVDNFENLAQVDSEGRKTYDIPDNLLISLISVAYSTARGMWFAKCMGTIFQDRIPPVVIPSELLTNYTVHEGLPKESSDEPLEQGSDS